MLLLLVVITSVQGSKVLFSVVVLQFIFPVLRYLGYFQIFNDNATNVSATFPLWDSSIISKITDLICKKITYCFILLSLVCVSETKHFSNQKSINI